MSFPVSCVSVPIEYYPYKQEEDGNEEEVDGAFLEDESSLPKGLRRSQSVKITRSKVVRKEVCMYIYI